ncbi:hypothetical protein ACHAXT_011420 [Thalassiosira profunda]
MRTKQSSIDSREDATSSVVDLPPLDALVAPNGTIVGDISWLLDFAIVGFPKAGTTFLKDHLNRTSETFVFERELCMKHPSDVADFVRIYHSLHMRLKQPKHPKTLQFGLKCPGVLYRAHDIHFYEQYFPQTKLIVGLRHPVSWFESFYNYQAWRNVTMPPSSQLIGRCEKHGKVCSDRARFHAALARLGKTPMEDGREMDLLLGTRYEVEQSAQNDERILIHSRSLKGRMTGPPNPVMLYEIRQIHDAAEASSELSKSLQRYLGINQVFPEIQSFVQTKSRAIDICDKEHADARTVLVEHGTDAAVWIREYLLADPSVEVASPKSFWRFMDGWSKDPCPNDSNS